MLGGMNMMNLMPRRFPFGSEIDDFFKDGFQGGMQCDIYEKDGNCYVEADIPGFSKDEIAVEVDDGYLTITASKNQEDNKEDVNYLRRERVSREMQRKFYLGDIDEENIKAEFRDGILKLCIPKAPEKEHKKLISID